MDRDRRTPGDLGGRLALVVGAEIVFATLVDLVTGTPPAFIATVAFGMALAIGLGWQAHSTAAWGEGPSM